VGYRAKKKNNKKFLHKIGLEKLTSGVVGNMMNMKIFTGFQYKASAYEYTKLNSVLPTTRLDTKNRHTLLLVRILNKKSSPLQAWSDPEGSRKLRFPDFMTTGQDGGKVVSFTHRPPLPPRNTPGTHFC